MDNRKVFLYGRVSTDQQATGLEAQTRALTDYCRLNLLAEAATGITKFPEAA